MLEDKHHRQLLEEQAETFDGCSHKFHKQDMQPTMQKVEVNTQKYTVKPL